MTNKEVRINMSVYHKFRPGQEGKVIATGIVTDAYSRSGRQQKRHKVQWSNGQLVAEQAIDLRRTPAYWG